MQDRLSELRQAAAIRDPALADILPGKVSAIFEQRKKNERTDMGIFEAQFDNDSDGKGKEHVFMAEYLTKINLIKQSIAEIYDSAEGIKALKQKMVLSATPSDEQAASNELQKMINETNKSVMATKNALGSLKQENDLFWSRNPDSSEARIRENMHAALTRKFRELLQDYRNLQTDYKKAVKEKIERQVRIVYPEMDEREVQELVDDSDSMVAQKAIMARMTGAHENIMYAVQDIEMKHKDVMRLEQSVQELHQMFVDLATLVEAQGELLDQIEFSVQNAKDYTEKAEKDLVQARINQAKSKKWACWISTCLIILAVIIILPIVVYVSG